jgi:hypothetical protein
MSTAAVDHHTSKRSTVSSAVSSKSAVRAPAKPIDTDALLLAFWGHMLITNEFHLALGDEAQHLTHVRLFPAVEYVRAEKMDVPGPKTLTPLTRLFYHIFARKCPALTDPGAEFMDRLDELVDSVFLKGLKIVIKGIQIDALALQDHAITISANVNNLIVGNTYSFEPFAEEQLWPWALPMRAERPFDIRGLEAVDAKDSAGQVREEKYLALVSSISLLVAAYELALKAHPNYWKVFEECPTVETLPKEYRRVFKCINDALARFIDFFFEEGNRRLALTSIINKLPISLITNSLKIVDPTPFVEQMVQVFTMKPPGLPSLLQVIGGFFCSKGSTKDSIKDLKKNMDRKHVTMLDELLKQTKDAPNKRTRVKSIQNLATETLDKASWEYIKFCLRKEEKDDLVDFLADKDTIAIIRHATKIAPTWIGKVSQYGSLPDFVHNFLTSVKKVLNILKIYDTPNVGRGPAPRYHKEVIPEIREAILPDMHFIYGMMHAAGSDAQFGLLHETADWAVKLAHRITRGAPTAKDVLAHLPEKDVQFMRETMEKYANQPHPTFPKDGRGFEKGAAVLYKILAKTFLPDV